METYDRAPIHQRLRSPLNFSAEQQDADLGLIYVNASNGLARAQGVRPGALISNIGRDRSVAMEVGTRGVEGELLYSSFLLLLAKASNLLSMASNRE